MTHSFDIKARTPFSKLRFLQGIGIISLLISTTTAQDGAPSPLPEPVNPSHFASLMKHSPFTRIVQLSDSLILAGVAHLDGKPIAPLMNTEVAESILVSDAPTTRGWRLVELAGSGDIETGTRSQLGSVSSSGFAR